MVSLRTNMDVLSAFSNHRILGDGGSYPSRILADPWSLFLWSFLGETEGPFLGADLRGWAPGAQVGSRRLRAARCSGTS
jgi:hypothetical protein